MKLEVNIDPSCEQPRVVIYTDRMTDEVSELVRRLSAQQTNALTAYTERGVELLPIDQIIRVYAAQQKVYAQTPSGNYPLRARLYEIEQRLEGHPFVRISGSELVNTRMILGMDFSLTGTIRMSLRGGITTYVSRRNVSAIKKKFEV